MGQWQEEKDMRRLLIFLAGLNGGVAFGLLLAGAYDYAVLAIVGLFFCVLAAKGEPK